MDPILFVIQISVVVPLYFLLQRILLPEREMHLTQKAEAENLARAKSAYIQDQRRPRYCGKLSSPSHLGLVRIYLKIHKFMFFLGGIFKGRSVQKLIYEISLDLPEPYDFASFQSLYVAHQLPMTKSTTRECGYADFTKTGFPSMFGETGSDPAFDGLSLHQKRIYTNLVINELKAGADVGPLFYSCTWMWYAKLNEKKDLKIGDYYAADVYNAIKIGLIVNSVNTSINQAQDSNKPSLDWFRSTVKNMQETVSYSVPRIINFLLI